MRVPSDMPPRRRQKTRKRGHRGRVALIVVFAALIALFLSARGIAGFYTDYLWFDSLGYTKVWSGILGAKIALAALFTAIFFVLLMLNLVLAGKLAPRFRAPGPEEEFLERYQNLVGRRTWLVNLAVSLVFGLIAGVGVSGQWRDWLLFTNRVDFGVQDPQFGLDVGFYVFQLPFLSFLVTWLFAALVIIFIVTTVAHYLNGGIRVQVPGQRVTPQVKAHLSVLLALLALLKAAGYWLQRYQLTLSTRGTVDGATYTDVKAQLPAINLLVLISLGAAVLLIINIWQRGWRLPVIAVGLWGLVAVVAGAAYPEVVQRFQVQPAESSRERPYIERNIAATRAALGLTPDRLETIDYPTEPLSADALQAAQDQLKRVRLLDPNVVKNAFQLLRGENTFYRFTDLDVDRYDIGGDTSQVVISSRELNPDGLPQNTWEARHLAYTHGYGVEVAPADRVRQNGAPAFVDLNPEAVGPSLQQPEIYFGEDLLDYAVVATDRNEISATGPSSYTGTGGVGVGSRLRRLAFALRFGEPNLFVSNQITGKSRILYVRDVHERVKLLAPFLDFDADPYPVLVDQRIYWVIDGYTTTSRYPYAQRAAQSGKAGSGLNKSFNYVRNSVKAVVDAYNGSVSFYVVDPTDPLARAYQKAFPDLLRPASEIPPGFPEHFRYPEDLFRVQTTMWGRYHQDDPSTFYQQSDGWNVAQSPQSAQAANADGTAARAQRIDPFYALMQLPDTQGQLGDKQFVLYRPYVPISDDDSRRELVSWMVASSDPGEYGKLRVYRIANAPGQQPPPGPALVQANIQSDATIAAELTLLDQQGSQVTFGNQVITPINNSLLFVTPLYVSATGGNQPPSLRRVVVTRANEEGEPESVIGATLQDALERSFPGAAVPNLGEQIVDENLNPATPEIDPVDQGQATTTTTTAPPTTTSSPTSTTAVTAPAGSSVNDLLAQANAAFAAADTALQSGDLATYQANIEKARGLVRQAEAVAGGPAPTTTVAGAAAATSTAAVTTASA